MRKVMHEYLGTENGGVEINHVINELEAINKRENIFTKKKTIAPQVKKRNNVYEVFRKFDADGSDSIDRLGSIFFLFFLFLFLFLFFFFN